MKMGKAFRTGWAVVKNEPEDGEPTRGHRSDEDISIEDLDKWGLLDADQALGMNPGEPAQIFKLERHAYAPELTTIHLTDGSKVQCSKWAEYGFFPMGVQTLDDAEAYLAMDRGGARA